MLLAFCHTGTLQLPEMQWFPKYRVLTLNKTIKLQLVNAVVLVIADISAQICLIIQ